MKKKKKLKIKEKYYFVYSRQSKIKVCIVKQSKVNGKQNAENISLYLYIYLC